MKLQIIAITTAFLIFGCSDESDRMNNAVENIRENVKQYDNQTSHEAKKSSIKAAIQRYLLDMGLSRPGDDFELETLLLSSSEGGGRNGPYLEDADHLTDPWGNTYYLLVPGELNSPFDVVSNRSTD